MGLMNILPSQTLKHMRVVELLALFYYLQLAIIYIYIGLFDEALGVPDSYSIQLKTIGDNMISIWCL